jgi:hypothetical protein
MKWGEHTVQDHDGERVDPELDISYEYLWMGGMAYLIPSDHLHHLLKSPISTR